MNIILYMENIKYKEIEEYNDVFMSKVLINNNTFMLKIDNLNINKNLYKKNNIVYLDLFLEEDDVSKKVLEKLKNYSINNVYKKYKNKLSLEKIKERYINNLKKINNKYSIILEVDDMCKILEKNQYNESKIITNKEIKKNDIVDLVLIFEGILYNKTDFRNKFIIIEIIKHIEKIEIFDEKKCYIETDSDDEDLNKTNIEYLNNTKKRSINKEEIPELE